MSASPPVLPGFQLIERLGRGAGGEVWAARNAAGERVAVKLLPPETADGGTARARLRREARLLRENPHGSLVRILADQSRATPSFLVLEIMEGGSLEGQQLPLGEVLEVGVRVAGALAHLHRLDIVHRDVKPANLLRDGHGVPFLADLGLGLSGEDSRLTATSDQVGTPAYLPPEALQGAPPLPSRDVFSLGMTLIELSTGSRPEVAVGGGVTFAWERLPPLIANTLRWATRSHAEDRPSAGQLGNLLEEARLRHQEDPVGRGTRSPPPTAPAGSGRNRASASPPEPLPGGVGRRSESPPSGPGLVRRAALPLALLGLLLGAPLGVVLGRIPGFQAGSPEPEPSTRARSDWEYPEDWEQVTRGQPRLVAGRPACPRPLVALSLAGGRHLLALLQEDGALRVWSADETGDGVRFRPLLTVPAWVGGEGGEPDLRADSREIRLRLPDASGGQLLQVGWDGLPGGAPE